MVAAARSSRGASRHRAWPWAVVLLLAVTCPVVVWWSSATHGLGVAPDSVVYLEAAENLLAGRGFSYQGLPLTHFPPGFPTLLAAAARLLGTTPIAAARYVQALLLGFSVLLLAWTAYHSSSGSASVTAAATLLLAVFTQTYGTHLWVVSEPLSLFLTLASLGFVVLYLKGSSGRWLVAAAAAAGLGTVTRYAAAALIPVLLWVAWRYTPRNKRLGTGLAVLLCSAGPFVAWTMRNVLLGQKATNRSLVYHPIPVERWLEFEQSVVQMALPELSLGTQLTSLLAWGMIALIVLVIALWIRKESRAPDAVRPGARLIGVLLVFVLSYLVVLALSLAFFDASITVTGRTVIIPFVALTIVALSSAHQLAVSRGHALWWGLLLCLLPFALRNAEVSWRMARVNRELGGGYASVAWVNSPLLSSVQTLAPEVILYTNASDAIEFVTGREAAFLPRLYDMTSLVTNPNYARELELVCAQCKGGRAVVVYLYRIPGRWQYGTREELLSRCPLEYLGEWSDGAILGRRQQ